MNIIKRAMMAMGVLFTLLIIGVILDGATDGRYSIDNLLDSFAYAFAGIYIAKWVSTREK
jgi:hypothetical protein